VSAVCGTGILPVNSLVRESFLHLVRYRASLYHKNMAADDLRSLLTRDPFVPFRVRLTSGDYYDIRDPHLTVLMKSRLFIALPRSDRSVYVPYLHIAALETLENGRPARGRRRRK
jgi:hypothetical protein